MTARICLELWGADPRRLVQIARHAEAVGLDGVYLGESPTSLHAETWTTLGAIAGSTDRIRIGPVIANLLPDYRSAILLARQGAALANLSQGRFDFRTGVGATTSVGRAWWEPAGVAYPPYATRLAETDRQLRLIAALWRGEATTVDGRRYSLDLDHPPIEITVAASSPRSLLLAAEHGQRWETSFATPAEWAARAAAGPHDLSSSLEVDGFLGATDQMTRRLARDRPGEDVEALLERALVGTPADVAQQIVHLQTIGVDQIVVALHDPTDAGAVDALGEAVALARG